MVKMSDKDAKDFAQIVRAKRTERGWSMQALADVAGIHKDTVYYLENCKHRPTRTIRELICDALEIEDIWQK